MCTLGATTAEAISGRSKIDGTARKVASRSSPRGAVCVELNPMSIRSGAFAVMPGAKHREAARVQVTLKERRRLKAAQPSGNIRSKLKIFNTNVRFTLDVLRASRELTHFLRPHVILESRDRKSCQALSLPVRSSAPL